MSFTIKLILRCCFCEINRFLNRDSLRKTTAIKSDENEITASSTQSLEIYLSLFVRKINRKTEFYGFFFLPRFVRYKWSTVKLCSGIAKAMYCKRKWPRTAWNIWYQWIFELYFGFTNRSELDAKRFEHNVSKLSSEIQTDVHMSTWPQQKLKPTHTQKERKRTRGEKSSTIIKYIIRNIYTAHVLMVSLSLSFSK